MIAPVDRTAELFACIPRPPGGAKPAPSLHPITATHAYTLQTAELSRQILAMQRELASKRRRYVDFTSMRGLSDSGRDALDASVATFMRGCVAEIDALKTAAVADLKSGTGNASFPAHRLGGVAILNELLQGVSALSEEMRHARIRAAIDARAKPQVQYSKKAAKEAARTALEREAEAGGGSAQSPAEEVADMGMYAQEFASENAALVSDLVETREQVREAERTVVEIASLNQFFASKVMEQGREIDTLYELAVEATLFVDRGNKELRKMKGKGPVMKYYIGGGILVLIFAMFFLDWFANRKSIFIPL